MKTGFLDGGGEMGALLRSHPWAPSLLGAVEQWPDSLRTVVSLMLNAPFPMFLLWGEQRVCLYNDGYIPLLGKRHPAALAAPFQQVWPEVWDEISPLIDRAYAGTSTFFENFPLLIERNGFPEQAYFTFSHSPLRGPQGGVEGMFCTWTETTAQMQAEVALRHNEARWRGLFEHMQEGFFVAEAMRDEQGRIVDFRYVEVNPAFEIQRGLASSVAAVGRSMREMLPQIPAQLLRTYVEVVESGQPRQFEIDLGRVNGRWYEVRARTAESAEHIAVLFLDITARKKVEVALHRSEAQFRGLAQAIPNQAWTARADGGLDWFNDRVYDYAGVAVGDLEGDRWASSILMIWLRRRRNGRSRWPAEPRIKRSFACAVPTVPGAGISRAPYRSSPRMAASGAGSVPVPTSRCRSAQPNCSNCASPSAAASWSRPMRNCASRRRWRRWASSPAASRMISTTC